MKVAIIVGHNKNSKGAFSGGLNVSEFDFFKQVSSIIKKNAPSVDIYERKDVGSYSREMKEVIDEINKKGYDLALELHFNACDGKANGVEVLHYKGSQRGIEWSNSIIKIHELVTGVKSRGLIPVADNSRNGSYGIMNSKMPYLLTESFFGDSISDTDKVDVKKIAICFLLFLHSIGVEVKPRKESEDSVELRLDKIEKRLSEIESRI
ncbi:MAG: N-acetylmuramoyl-L-alanine amidase [Cetobacterium sp.]